VHRFFKNATRLDAYPYQSEESCTYWLYCYELGLIL